MSPPTFQRRIYYDFNIIWLIDMGIRATAELWRSLIPINNIWTSDPHNNNVQARTIFRQLLRSAGYALLTHRIRPIWHIRRLCNTTTTAAAAGVRYPVQTDCSDYTIRSSRRKTSVVPWECDTYHYIMLCKHLDCLNV